MPRKIKVVDIQAVEESVFETAQEDNYLDVKEEAVKEDAVGARPAPPSPEEVINEQSIIAESKDDKPTKELVKCQYCNKSMLPKSLKYSHYQNCQGFKKINKINDKTDKTPAIAPAPITPPPPPPEPPTPAPVSPAVIAKPKQKPKPRPKPTPQEEVNHETEASPQPVSKHPRTERMNLLKERYNNLIKNAFNV
jgi:hypothetical protein